MTRGWWKTMGPGPALGAVMLAAVALWAQAPGVSAQAVDEDCRCVDVDGNAIDDCTCFVIPDLSDLPDGPGMARIMAFGPDGRFGSMFGAPRPRLGVTVDADQEDAYDGQGARVTDVLDGGPADEAGIREGDVITSVAGRSLFQPLDDELEEDLDLDRSVPVQRLLLLARDLEPGQAVEVAYLRDGESMTATVEVQDLAGMWGSWADDFMTDFGPRMERFGEELRPRMEELRVRLREQARELEDADSRRGQTRMERIVVGPGGSVARFGVRVTELTPGLAEYFGADQGVLVSDVEESSTLGLRAGDIVLRIGDRDVTSPSRMARVLSTYDPGESITLRVLRDGAEIDVMGRVDD